MTDFEPINEEERQQRLYERANASLFISYGLPEDFSLWLGKNNPEIPYKTHLEHALEPLHQIVEARELISLMDEHYMETKQKNYYKEPDFCLLPEEQYNIYRRYCEALPRMVTQSSQEPILNPVYFYLKAIVIAAPVQEVTFTFKSKGIK